MPAWHDKMTAADFDRNARDMAQARRNEAGMLRLRARQMLAQADRLDPPMQGDTSNDSPRMERP